MLRADSINSLKPMMQELYDQGKKDRSDGLTPDQARQRVESFSHPEVLSGGQKSRFLSQEYDADNPEKQRQILLDAGISSYWDGYTDVLNGSVALRDRGVTCYFFTMLPDHAFDPKCLQAAALSRRYYCPVCSLVLAYALSLRNLEEMRGIVVDHSTLHRWVIRLVPLLDEVFADISAQSSAMAYG
ncbi:Uncharacterised protein [Klebsiella variicola]|nr:Uncharacterised protein [Klebsiella variicola]